MQKVCYSFLCFSSKPYETLKLVILKAKHSLTWYPRLLAIILQFYKSFSSGLKDVMWKPEESSKEVR